MIKLSDANLRYPHFIKRGNNYVKILSIAPIANKIDVRLEDHTSMLMNTLDRVYELTDIPTIFYVHGVEIVDIRSYATTLEKTRYYHLVDSLVMSARRQGKQYRTIAFESYHTFEYNRLRDYKKVYSTLVLIMLQYGLELVGIK
jgi:hypothetical protein